MRPMIEYLSADYVRQLIEVETARLGRGEIASLSDDRRPPVRLRELENPRTGTLPPMVDTIAQNIQNIKGQFAPEFAPSKTKPAAALASSSGDGEPAIVASGELTVAGTFSETLVGPVGASSAVGVGDGPRENAAGAPPIRLNGPVVTGYTVHVGHGGIVEHGPTEAPYAPAADPADDDAPEVPTAVLRPQEAVLPATNEVA
jgi:hypothetical protein